MTCPVALADALAFAERYHEVRKISATVNFPLELNRPKPVLRHDVPPELDRRPPAVSREPCPRCQIRGELGCEHYRPFIAGALESFARFGPRHSRKMLWGAKE